MAHCININHPEYKKLVPQFKGPEALLKAKISIWQENNGLDNFPTIDQLEERKNILYDKMSIEEKIQDKLKVSENVLKIVADKLSKRTNIPYSVVNYEDIKDKYEDVESTTKGFYAPGERAIYFIRGNFTLETAFHEFAHPIVDSILTKNRILFRDLSVELQSDKYKDSFAEVVKKYAFDYKFDTTVTQEQLNDYNVEDTFKFFNTLPRDIRIKLLSEGITNAWGQESETWIDETTGKIKVNLAEVNPLVRLWQMIVDWFKEFIATGKVEDIKPTTTIRELGQMLALGDNDIQIEDINRDAVKYTLKVIDILDSDKAKQIFEKGNKNNWSLDKILTELAIPKEQKQLLLDLGITDREQLALELASKYGFSVEINTAKGRKVFDRGGENYADFILNNIRYTTDNEGSYGKEINGKFIDITAEEYSNAFKEYNNENEPTQYYSNLSAPGGTGRNKYEGNPDWEYQELEFKTPLITPSIKGHAKFATDNGIGWARVWYNKKTGVVEIQEIQSDLFQKGRDKEDLINQKLGDFEDEIKQESDGTWSIYNNVVGLIEGGFKTEKEALAFSGSSKEDISKNQFLQLLNKDNNWVTFFIKAIIQDSAKKGYEKVLFPRGETAAKIEGHETIAEELIKLNASAKEVRYKEVGEMFKVYHKEYIKLSNGYGEIYKKGQFIQDYKYNKVTYEEVIQPIEERKSELKSQGIEKLKPIEAFYEIKVTNILKKLGNINEVTDEYGNSWNEVTITPENRNTILLQKNDTNAKFDNEIKKIYDKLEMYSYDEYIPAIKYSNAVHLIQQYNRDNNNSNYELAMKRYYNRTSKIVVQPKSLIESKENNLLTKDEGNIRMTINDLFKKVDKDVKHEMEIALKIRTIEIKKVSEVPNEYSIMKVADLHHKELTKQYGALEGTIKYFEEITALNKRFNIKEFLNEEELKPFEEKLNDYNANNPGNSHFYQKINLPTNDKRDKYIFKINFTKVENIADQQNTIISNIEEDNSISLDNKQEEKTDEEIKQELLAKKDFEKKAENIKENIIQYGNVQGKEFSQQKIIFPEDINLTDTQKSMLMNFDTHFPNYSFLTLLEKTLLIEALGDGDITMYCNI